MPVYEVTAAATGSAHASIWRQEEFPNPLIEKLSITDTETRKIEADWGNFIVAQPLDHYDGREGSVCAASGLWYPGHLVRYFLGLPYGEDLVPEGIPPAPLF
jgi:hypothetical protein